MTGIATTGVSVLVFPTTVTTATTLVGQMAGAFTVNGTNVAAAANCTFNGTTTDNALTGNGTLAGRCSGTAAVTPPGATATFDVSCTAQYTRNGTTVTVSAACSGSATVTVPYYMLPLSYCGNGVMEWVPTGLQGNEFIVAGTLAMRPVPSGGCGTLL